MKSKEKTKKARIKTKRTKIKKRRTPSLQDKCKGKIKKIWQKNDLNKFKQLLINLREKIVGEVEHIANNTLKQSQREAAGDLSGYTLHMADMASDHYDREFSLSIASTEQNIIYEIDEALRRIKDGSYGICFTCEKPIAKRRLKAVPYAKLCVNCQQKEELIQKRTL
ncbi:MAG: TraR/DksA family transcriptional regulator [Candidatus Omnitrophica bacterium]|nr:TraR/DksA family transcriptional regulator [Candidatus Omnitrophota bacterium]